ncbi:hypothetical protein C7B82_23720 [Stenomitos frigidus ULC18]|uniref:DUF4352 domain-containing protein n=2 Tax=Stenomitos TaxID=1844270 RepID=A0A2T1DY14_9CYAN|nr:hypothetical protein C7B82_23720 [Stenomitos frigidus ULC18]
MKLNSTVALTLILLVSMVAAGLVSASWGSSLGREALKGITQPDTRPSNNKAGNRAGTTRREELAVLPESDIIANVKVRMNGGTGKDLKASPVATTKAATTSAAKTELPLSVTSQDVMLEVKSARQQGELMVLAVSLQNGGKQSIRFVYDALNVTDEQGRTLKASMEGLPAELPAASRAFPGTVSISANLLDGVQKVSLSLTDYPDKRLQLQLSNIPLVR